ncbi:MAG: prophage regulatory protein [Solirubrobacterales bacterium]|jgi:predicted DNA-binding transcriptional regulator AlpA|nr:prophage regulatory protein [Solirubrobacterales bacterium]
MHHLVGVAEIAEMLSVSRQRVNRIVQTDADFPAPEAELSAGRIWQRSQVEAWARRHRRWPPELTLP